jgi:hypothetical protein
VTRLPRRPAQITDAAIWLLAWFARWALGWRWTDGQRAQLTAAMDVAATAYEQHGRRRDTTGGAP